VLKRGTKKRKLDQSQSLFPGKVSSFEVLWKGSSPTPIEELGNLTQFKGAYDLAIIHKDVELQELLKEKEDKIISLEEPLNIEKHKFNERWQNQVSGLQQKFDALKVQHDKGVQIKDNKIKEMRKKIEKLDVSSQLAEFKKKAKELNSLLKHQ